MIISKANDKSFGQGMERGVKQMALRIQKRAGSLNAGKKKIDRGNNFASVIS